MADDARPSTEQLVAGLDMPVAMRTRFERCNAIIARQRAITNERALPRAKGASVDDELERNRKLGKEFAALQLEFEQLHSEIRQMLGDATAA